MHLHVLRSIIFSFLLGHVLSDVHPPNTHAPRYVPVGDTQAPDLTRLHRRKVNEEEEEKADNNGYAPAKLSFSISPLGQIYVHPSHQFINFTQTHESTDKPEESSHNLTGLERLSIPNLGSIESSLGLADNQYSFSSTQGILKRPTVASYFPDWNLEVLSPEHIDYSKYDLIDFAFAIPNEQFGVDFTQSDSTQTLDKLVHYAHGNHTLVCLSIGGWDGSKYFSSAVRTVASRETFSNNIINLINKHKLDGVDIDWEYPAEQGIQGNQVDRDDSSSMLLFFELLREKLGPSKIISAAVTDYTFKDNHDHHMTDVAPFGKVLDHILVMNYDYSDSSATPGPNAPFTNKCADTSQPGGNMVSAITSWTDAGFPADKILMGLPAYGYINWSAATKLVHRSHEVFPRTRFEQYLAHLDRRRLVRRQELCPDSDDDCEADSDDDDSSSGESSGSGLDRQVMPASGNGMHGDLKTYPGTQIQFNDLFKWGVLKFDSSDPGHSLVGINGYVMAWDDCSSTPFLFNTALQTVVTFDDTKSIGLKSAYALKSGIGGVGFWDMTGDPHSILTNVARAQLGKK